MGRTPQQKKAIETEAGNILVSAAAGSGKTSVLTDRIARIVIADRIPLRRILVVTFTEAAAAEMKERIVLALENANQDGDRFIEEQIRRIGSARISTFHAFALTVLRQHYHVINMDPSFSVCDESRADTLKKEAVEEVVRGALPEFEDFFRNYSVAKNEKSIHSLILKVYNFIVSLPEPFEWLENAVNDLYGNPADFENSEAMRYAREEISRRIDKCLEITRKIGEDLRAEDFTSLAEKNDEDLSSLEDIAAAFSAGEHEKLRKLLAGYKRATFRAKKKETESGWNERKDLYALRRDRVKKSLDFLSKSFYARSMSEYAAEIGDVSRYANMLKELVRRFAETYSQLKRRENLIDFADIEHLALAILADDGISEDYKKNLEHIFIDEYQDSNYLQERLIERISRGNNVFMVGDVKQSIFKFRDAEPAIFLDKLDRYAKEYSENADGMSIDLFSNFRSKACVINSVNAVFDRIMDRQYAGVDYSEGQRLEAGLPCAGEMNRKTTLYLCEKDSKKLFFANNAENEAYACARIIHKLHGSERFDAKSNCMKPIEYRDIVILLRNVKNSAETMVNILDRMGIPAFTDRGAGYFETLEIDTFIGILKAVVNMRRDVPLATLLCSSAFGFDMENLADIRIESQRGNFYEAFLAYADGGKDEALREKCRSVLEKLAKWKNDERFMPLDEFLWKLMRESGFFDYAGALSHGTQRQANLRGLLDRARDFQRSRVRGLRAFIAYIEKLKKNDVVVPQVKLLEEDENVVRILTIHGSKGLEFPVVIQCGLSANLTARVREDNTVLLHNNIGLSLQWEDRKSHVYKTPLSHHAIKLRRELDERAEEIRLLYVAMTRAMDCLCLVGTVPDAEKKIELFKDSNPTLDTDVTGASTYLDLILPAIFANKHIFDVETVDYPDYFLPENAEAEGDENTEQVLTPKYDTRAALAEAAGAAARRDSDYVYPYEDEAKLKAKYSVTELANRGKAHEESVFFFSDGSRGEAEEDAGISGDRLSAAEKGTALHKALELLDFREAYAHRSEAEYFENYLEGLVDSGVLSIAEADAAGAQTLALFASGELCERAARSDYVMKEAPFNMRIPEEGIMVQGVMDLLFRDEGGLVVADYKSGHFNPGSAEDEARIRETYGTQLALYRRATEKIFGEPVKETVIYMTRAGVCVRL